MQRQGSQFDAGDYAVRRELSDLLTRRFFGDITGEQVARLAELVTANPSNRSLYVRMAAVQAELVRCAGYAREATRNQLESGAEVSDFASIINAVEDSPVVGARQEGQRRSHRQPMLGWRNWAAPNLRWFAAAAATAVFAWAILSVYLLQSFRRAEPELARQDSFGVFSRGVECRWGGVDRGLLPGAPLTTQNLRLAEGFAEFKLNNGLVMTVEGPAEFRFNDEREAVLDSGSLTAIVPAAARGFVVATPSARVEDLGTEFGVRVLRTDDSDTVTKVELFRGHVVVRPGNGKAGPAETHLRVAGSSIVVGDDRGVASQSPALRQPFVRTLPADSSKETEPASYEDRILADRPVLYFRFEEDNSADYVRDLATFPPRGASPDRQLCLASRTATTALGEAGPRPPEFPTLPSDNRAAAFNGYSSIVRVRDPGSESSLDFGNGDAITLEAWVNPREIIWDSPVYVVGKGRQRDGHFKWYAQNYALRLHKVDGLARLSFMFRNCEDLQGDENSFHRWCSHDGFKPGSGWHHIALSYQFGEPESIRGYLDGEPVKGNWELLGPTKLAPIQDDSEVWIGSSQMAVNRGNAFDGLLDEVAIWRKALPAEQIRQRVKGATSEAVSKAGVERTP